MKEMLTNFHKQQAIWAVVLGFGLSLAIVAGYTYDMTTFCSMTAISALLLLFLFIVLAFGFYLLLVYVTCRTKVTIKKHSWKPTRRDIVIAIVVMAVPQFIMWAIAAPGVYSHDGPYHVLQVINPENTLQLKNNHSVLYSLLLGEAVNITNAWGSPEIGFGFVMLLQSVVLIAIQTKALIFIGEESRSKVFFWIALVFFAFNPFGIIMKFSSCQDTFFAGFLLLAIMEAFKLSKKICEGKDVSCKQVLPFLIWILLVCLMRNNGVYFYAFAIIFMLAFLIKRKLFKTIGYFCLPILAAIVIMGPIYSACGVIDTKTGIREISSIETQQLTRAYANNPDSFTEVEKETFEKFYPTITKDGCEFYWAYPGIADFSKQKMDMDAVRADLGGYVSFYLEIGAKNIDSYVDAFFMNTLGWWYPFKHYPDFGIRHAYAKYTNTANIKIDDPNYTEINRISVCPEVDALFGDVFSNDQTWNNVPVINVLLKTGLYFWIFIVLCAIAILNKRKDARLSFLLILGLLLTYLLGPLCYFRYSYSIILCIPVLMLVAFRQRSEKLEEKCQQDGN